MIWLSFTGMSWRAQYRVRDRSGILLWSDSGTKDTADSPTLLGHAQNNKLSLQGF
ncbi:MAG TPA: hypothetical protein PLT79_01000 [Flavobacterium sp.]|nr:hypothetical protein [Flavobacterium sp.]